MFTDVALVLASRTSEAGFRQSLRRRNPLLWSMIGGLMVVLGLVQFTAAGEALFDFGPIDVAGALAAGLAVLAVSIAIGKANSRGLRKPMGASAAP